MGCCGNLSRSVLTIQGGNGGSQCPERLATNAFFSSPLPKTAYRILESYGLDSLYPRTGVSAWKWVEHSLKQATLGRVAMDRHLIRSLPS
jgi:hypothetical protein